MTITAGPGNTMSAIPTTTTVEPMTATMTLRATAGVVTAASAQRWRLMLVAYMPDQRTALPHFATALEGTAAKAGTPVMIAAEP